jgi:hypothetical protein
MFTVFLKAFWNIKVFSPDLNLLRHYSSRKFDGSEFHIWVALIENALSVDLKWCWGLISLRMLGSKLILREYDAWGSFKHIRSFRYEGAQWLIALKVRRAILSSRVSFDAILRRFLNDMLQFCATADMRACNERESSKTKQRFLALLTREIVD